MKIYAGVISSVLVFNKVSSINVFNIGSVSSVKSIRCDIFTDGTHKTNNLGSYKPEIKSNCPECISVDDFCEGKKFRS